MVVRFGGEWNLISADFTKATRQPSLAYDGASAKQAFKFRKL